MSPYTHKRTWCGCRREQVEVFFKRSLEGNDDPEWQTFVKGQVQQQQQQMQRQHRVQQHQPQHQPRQQPQAAPGRSDLEAAKRFIDAVTNNRVADATALLSAPFRAVQGRHPLVTVTHGGWTPLAIAGWHGHVEILRILLRAGAPVNVAKQGGETAVYHAAQQGKLDAVKLLLEHRADPAQANQNGANALCVAVEQGHEDVVRFLVEDIQMSLDTKLHGGSNLLSLAARGGNSIGGAESTGSPAGGNGRLVEYLLAQDVPVTANNEGMTPYHIACNRGRHAILGVLIKHATQDPKRLERVRSAADASASAAVAQKARADALSAQLSRAQQLLPEKLERMAAARDKCKAAVEALAEAEREADAARADVLGIPLQFDIDVPGEVDPRREKHFVDVMHVSSKLAGAAQHAANTDAQRVNEGERLEQSITNTVVPNVMKALEHSIRHKVEAASQAVATAEAAEERAAHPDGDHIAEINATNARGETPLFLACMFVVDLPRDSSKAAVLPSLSTQELVGLVKQHGPNTGMEAHLRSRKDLLELALTLDLSAADLSKLRNVDVARDAQLKTVDIMLAAGADPNIRTHSGHSALFVACQRGASDVVRLLLAAGADATVRPPPAGLTLLYISAFAGHLSAVKILCEDASADPNELTGQFQFSALMPAAQEGHLEVVQYLHSRKADPSLVNSAGNTALWFASKFNRVDVVKYLLEDMHVLPDICGGAASTPLYVSATAGSCDVAIHLLNAGADVNASKDNGATPLLVATEHGHIDMVQLLAKNGADPTAVLNQCQSNVMMIAALHGRAVILRQLIQQFPDVDPLKSNRLGVSPLHAASRQGHMGVIRVLLEETPAADPLQLDSHRHTSLHLAVQSQHLDVANVLLAHAAASVYRSANLAQTTQEASGASDGAVDTDLFLPRTGSLAEEAEELLREPEPASSDEEITAIPGSASTSGDDYLVTRKMRWLRGAIDAFMPSRPRVVLNSSRVNILSTLPQSGFLSLDIRSGLDVQFAGSQARGDGMRREWLELVCAEFMNPDVNLFRSRDGGRTFDPSPTGSLTNVDHIAHLKAVGRVVGIALLHGECMRHALFSEPLLRQILGLPLLPECIASIDPVLYNNKIKPILELSEDSDPDEVELYLDGLVFTVTTDPDMSPCYFGERTTHELCPGGAGREVTLTNKDEYIEKLSLWYQRTETEAEIDAIVSGVKDVLHPSVLESMKKVITTSELLVLIAGRESFDVQDWRKHTVFRGFADDAPQPKWLQELLEEAEPAFRRGLLRYSTGSTNVPMGGFGAINPPFTIQARPELSADHLPTSSTCVNMLNLPVYPTKEAMRAALEKAIEQMQVS